jgi:hypothetical protein
MKGHVVSEDELPTRYTRPVQEIYGSLEGTALSPNQKLLSALLLRTLRSYRRGWFRSSEGGVGTLRLLVGVFMVISVAAWVLMATGARTVYRPTFNTDVGFYSMTFVGVACLLAIRLLWSFPGTVTLVRGRSRSEKEPRISRLCLGQIDHFLDPKNLNLVLFSFLFLVVMQVTLLSFTRNHCGIPFDGDFLTSFLLTLDNLFHGIFLDVCELYGLRLGDKIEHNSWSASFFLFFRLGYDAMFLLVIYLGWQRWSTRKLFRRLPGDSAELVAWLGTELDTAWFKKFPTEYTFLMLARDYLSGRYDVVRAVGSEFPNLGIHGEVRALFVDEGGEALLPAAATVGRTDAS